MTPNASRTKAEVEAKIAQSVLKVADDAYNACIAKYLGY